MDEHPNAVTARRRKIIDGLREEYRAATFDLFRKKARAQLIREELERREGETDDG